ncbi:hypothetical protein RJT34_32149 [Clitoria ternatea]
MSGPECCSKPPVLDPSSGDGHVQQFAGLNSYLTGSPHSNHAIIFVSDIFGFEAPLLRKLADKVAAAGYYVVVPDFFNGDPFDSKYLDGPPEDINRPLLEWKKNHEPDKGIEAAKPIIEALKSQGASAIGAVGFCWGAMTNCDLGKSKLIQATVILHPAFITVDNINGVNIPIAILGAEHDTVTPPEQIKQFEQVLTAKPEVDSFVKIFPGVHHGWTVRYATEDPEAVKPAEESHKILLDWFDKYLNSGAVFPRLLFSAATMVRVSVLNDALKSMYNAEKRGKRQVMIRPSSKVIIKFLLVMQKHGYIGEFEYVDDHRAGKIVVELNGRLNKCGVISPRFDVGVKEIEGWTARLLPSRQFGFIVLTTSAGIMDHEEARRKNVGGKVLGFFY